MTVIQHKYIEIMLVMASDCLAGGREEVRR